MVRVASLKDMVHANYKKKDIAGMTASEQLEKINERTRELVTLTVLLCRLCTSMGSL